MNSASDRSWDSDPAVASTSDGAPVARGGGARDGGTGGGGRGGTGGKAEGGFSNGGGGPPNTAGVGTNVVPVRSWVSSFLGRFGSGSFTPVAEYGNPGTFDEPESDCVCV